IRPRSNDRDHSLRFGSQISINALQSRLAGFQSSRSRAFAGIGSRPLISDNDEGGSSSPLARHSLGEGGRSRCQTSQRVGTTRSTLFCVPALKASRVFTVTAEAAGSDVVLVSLGVSGLEWVLA